MSLWSRLAIATGLASAAVVLGASAASANYPYPPGAPQGISPMVTDVAPADCATWAPAGSVSAGVNVNALCKRATAAAASTTAAGAIRFGFSKLGTAYSQDPTLRATTLFDCSSFVGRALNAGGGKIRRSDGTLVPVFPYFGWTGAYVLGGWNSGYRDTNMRRLASKSDLRPGDIIIQFNGTDPSKSAGNAGHAMMYLGEGMAIQSGGAPDGTSKVSVIPYVNYFTNAWYFRYVPIGSTGSVTPTPTPSPTVVPTPSPKPTPTTTVKPPAAAGSVSVIKAGTANSTVIGTIGVTDAVQAGQITAYPCAQGRPSTTNVSYLAKRAARVTTFVRSDAAGNICLYTSSQAHLTFDLRLVTPTMAIHNGVTRLDTSDPQDGGAKTVPGQIRRIPAGVANKTAVGTLTASDASAAGFAAVIPCGAPWPGISSLYFLPGQTVSNTAAVKADALGYICVYTSAAVHLQWDQVAETITIPNAAPKRAFDTRLPSFFGGIPLPAYSPATFLQVEANRSVFGNLTVVGADAPGFITIWPCASPRPAIGNVAFAAGERVSAFIATSSDASGKVCMFTTARTHVVWDTSATTNWYLMKPPVRVFSTSG